MDIPKLSKIQKLALLENAIEQNILIWIGIHTVNDERTNFKLNLVKPLEIKEDLLFYDIFSEIFKTSLDTILVIRETLGGINGKDY